MKNEKLLDKLLAVQEKGIVEGKLQELIDQVRNELRLETGLPTKTILSIEKKIKKELNKHQKNMPVLTYSKTIGGVQYITDSYFLFGLKSFRLDGIQEVDESQIGKYPNVLPLLDICNEKKIAFTDEMKKSIKEKIKLKTFDKSSDAFKNHGLIKIADRYVNSFYLENAIDLIKPTKIRYDNEKEFKPITLENNAGDIAVISPVRVYE